MTAAPDSPPFALPLRFEEETDPDIAQPDYGWIWDADGAVVTVNPVYKPMALAIIRAVNSYAKMRDALEKISNHKQQAIPSALDGMAAQYSRIIRDFKSIARTILKEIDNG